MDPNDQTPDTTAAPDSAGTAATPAETPAATPPAVPEEDPVDVIDRALAAPEGAKPEDVPAATEPKPEGEKPAEAPKPEDKPAEPKPDGAKPEPDAEAKAEADKLGLKGYVNERFVSMATTIKAQAPLVEALEKAGIKSAEEITKFSERAAAADDMIEMVMATGATAEQYGSTLDYLGLVNKANQGDRTAAEKAFELVGKEYQELAKALGKEIPGIHDPLAEYPDLQKEVAEGDTTRARALEVAALRRQSALAQQAQSIGQQQQAQTQAQQQAQAQGVAQLRAWEGDKLADPDYLAIRDALSAKVAEIRKQFPPQQWVAVTGLAYDALMAQHRATKAATPATKPPPSAMRPTGAPRGLQPVEYADPMAAMDAALASMGNGEQAAA